MYFNEVLHELSQNCQLLSHRVCENWEVFGVAQVRKNDVFSDDILYFSDDLFSINKSSMPKNLLFSGPLPDFLNDQPISWIQVDPAQLHNAAAEVSRILLNHNKIQSLHLKIMDSFLHSRGFSTVLDEISQSLNTAIVVMDMSGKIISYSKPFNVADPLWRESVAKGYCPPFFMEHLRDVRQSDESPNTENAPIFRQCTNTRLFYLAKRMYTDGNLFGYVFMLQSTSNFDHACYDMVEYIAKMTVDFILGNPSAVNVKNRLYDNLLIDMFKGINGEQISSRILAGKMTFPDRMCIAAIKPRYFRGDNYIVGTLMNTLRQLFPKEHFVYFEKAAIVLFDLDGNFNLPDKTKDILRNLCSQERLVAGLSNPYSKVKSTRHYYQQAVKAIELSGMLDIADDVVEYVDFAFFDMISNAAEKVNVAFYCHPALATLREYDNDNSTQLYDTLRCYVKNGFNQNLTATELFLHRNSLSYRRQKIVSLTGLDLDDSETQFKLNYSFAIELYLEKTRM